MKLFGNQHGSHEAHKPDHPAPEGEQRPLEREQAPAEAAPTPPPVQPPEAEPPREPKKIPAEEKKKTGTVWTRHRGLFIALAAVVLALLALVVAYSIWEKPPEIAVNTPALPTATLAPSAAPTPTGTVETPDPEQPEETPEQPEESEDPMAAYGNGEAPAIDMTGNRRKGVYTMMIVGLDVVSSNTDTIIVVSFDTVNHKISLTNIPRDTIVNIAQAGAPKRINTIYPGMKASGYDPAKGLKQQLRNLLGFEVDSYAIVDVTAVTLAVDAIGGVWYDVPRDYYYVDYVQDLYIDIKEGYQLLSGQKAVWLCRFRDGYAGGDLERIGVQHDVLKTIAKQTLSLGNIPNFPTLIEIFEKFVDTDLTAANIAFFARQFLSCKSEDISFQTMPIGVAGMVNGVSMVSVAPEAWLEMINSSINPFEDDVQLYNLNLLIAGESFAYATSGTIAGGIDSFYCMSCTAHAGKTVWHAPGAHLYDEEGNLLNGEPEETDEPTETDGPEVTEGPTVTEAPPQTETPEVTETPVEPTPELSEPVGASQGPEGVVAPAAGDGSELTETP